MWWSKVQLKVQANRTAPSHSTFVENLGTNSQRASKWMSVVSRKTRFTTVDGQLALLGNASGCTKLIRSVVHPANALILVRRKHNSDTSLRRISTSPWTWTSSHSKALPTTVVRALTCFHRAAPQLSNISILHLPKQRSLFATTAERAPEVRIYTYTYPEPCHQGIYSAPMLDYFDMPFNDEGYYAHDFRRLPIIWEQDESHDHDDGWSSCVDHVSPISPTESTFQTAPSFTGSSASAHYSPIEALPEFPLPHSSGWVIPAPSGRTYRSWRPLEEEFQRGRVMEDTRPYLEDSEDEKEPRPTKTKRKWKLFRRWSKSKSPPSDDERDSSDSEGAWESLR
jgi:hypothetical protein